MAIIVVPDDEAVANNVKRRTLLRKRDDAKEPVVGEIRERFKTGRKITLTGVASLENIQKLTIIGHGASSGFLIGPYHTSNPGSPGDGIFASEMASLLRNAGYLNGYSIDVIGCFSEWFAMRLSGCLSGIYVKGYADAVTVQGEEKGWKSGKGLVTNFGPGEGKTRYLDGKPVTKVDYRQAKSVRVS